MDTQLADAVMDVIERHVGRTLRLLGTCDASGGSISRALRIDTDGGRWFVKYNDSGFLEMFAAEAEGLNALAACPALRIPHTIGAGRCGQHAFLVLEHIAMHPMGSRKESIDAGYALTALHRMEGPHFGGFRDNFIGWTPQTNRDGPDWPNFFARERLLPQIRTARLNGHAGAFITQGEFLAENIRAFFTDHRPSASLLHGDLWYGNAAIDETGKLVLFDPAPYYGDRETDLAMCELFGGFPPEFHSAYREAWPLSPGYAQRRTLYNLYHILNHLNLFGGAYREQSERMIGTLLAEIR